MLGAMQHLPKFRLCPTVAMFLTCSLKLAFSVSCLMKLQKNFIFEAEYVSKDIESF